MTTLTLNFLGDLEVIRDGAVMKLPPSKKTRGLLAYLALNDRQFRREQLCELLWEIPDDPRGSLRWSLSKLRRLVDDAEQPRIIADRTNVGFAAANAEIDVVALRALAENGLAQASVDELEAAARRYRGNFLEGLELSNFHEFHAWCIAEREDAARAQAGVLLTLIERLTDAPERALPHARALVSSSPYDESARATLIRLLITLDRTDEAEQHYALGKRMLDEVGAESSGALHQAWRGAQGSTTEQPAAPVARADPPERPAESLVGREAEIQRLANALSQVQDQRTAQLVLLRGEPGIGKTSLLRHVAELARDAGAFVLGARGSESETIRPFGLWIDALRRLPAGAAPGIFSSDGEDNRDRLFGRLSDLIARETDKGPVVVLFDNFQWCDESSAAALHYVARMNEPRPLLGVLAAREEELRDNTAVQRTLRGLRQDNLLTELKVGPLPQEAIRQLIAERAPEVDREQLSRECAGNPLLAIELARAKTSGDSGGSLDELVQERLARFDVEGAEVLRWAAVLNPRIDVDSLMRVTGMDSVRVGDVLETAQRQAMLQPSGRGVRFSHDLVMRGIYTGISPTRRQVMHRRVAELLEEDTALDLSHAADLAHHAALSGDPGLAARAVVSAGRLCLRFFANDDALSLARKGLQLVDQLTEAERVCLTIDLRDIMLTAAPLDDWEAAAREYVALAERALDHGALAHARLGYHMASYVRWAHGHWAGAREQSLQAERATRGGSEEEHILGMAEAAKCLAMLERDLTQADAMLMEAQALSRRRQLTPSAIPAGLGMLRYQENHLGEAEELFKEARTLCKSAGDRVNEFQANEYLVMIDLERGQLDAARERCAALVELGEKLREGSEAPFARALEGLCRYAMDDEIDDLEAALTDLRIADAKHRLAYTLTRTALLDLERGRAEDALARASEALGHAELLERVTEMMLAHVALAQAHRALNHTAEYERHAAAVAEFANVPVAQWARTRAERLMATEI